MRKNSVLVILLILAVMLLTAVNRNPGRNGDAMKEDKVHIASWNRFASNLLRLHREYTRRYKIKTRERIGGYSDRPGFYKEVSYYDSQSGRLLSRIQWERQNPQRPHVIEVFVYNRQGKVIRDYLVAWLPDFRNAPVQTLINLHSYDDQLHGFRQFDASGARIHEQCKGRYFNRKVYILLDEDDINPASGSRPKVMYSDAYVACFSELSVSATPYLNPLDEVKRMAGKRIDDAEMKSNRQIRKFSLLIKTYPKQGSLYVMRAQEYLKLRQFDKAIRDYDRALKLDPKNDDAWFGRGMAKGRAGQVREAIADLTGFLKLNPKSSLGYTKRGVRYIWIGKYKLAERDMRRALRYNPKNAEAHDDMGVLMARSRRYRKAIYHFRQSIRHDRTYQKAYHNLAIVYHLTRKSRKALQTINKGLQLRPNARNSMLLKAVILKSLGHRQEAANVREAALQLPSGSNWTEQLKLR